MILDFVKFTVSRGILKSKIFEHGYFYFDTTILSYMYLDISPLSRCGSLWCTSGVHRWLLNDVSGGEGYLLCTLL